ncbi:hypothetical protein RUM44_011283 [Polyplax serrata]|uniref:Integrator complex subunit 14 n=1 Tax=Polyplax serrata TaxID=468196 RepID=A0ABR1AR37_POLSC
MPTIILLDVSLSMIRPVNQAESGESYTILQLAVHGINFLLDYLAVHLKLEFVSLVTFSSSYEVLCPFTRDFELIRAKLSKIDEQDKTCIETALSGVNSLVLSDWGSSIPCQVILVTDGNAGVGQLNLKQHLQNLGPRSSHFPLPFPFPGKLHVICVCPGSSSGVSLFQRSVMQLSELAGNETGCVLMPEQGIVTPKTVQATFQKLCETNFSTFYGTLKCGNLSAKISLSPVPQPYTKVTDFESTTRSFSEVIEVCGFIDTADVGSPMAVSRHLIVPQPSGKGEISKVKLEADSDEECVDEGKTPSFCVLLHGALKVENMAALCTIGEDWFGIIYSWADSKKKSNLMLTVLEPGSDSVPWLGDLNYLGPLEEFSASSSQNSSTDNPPSFPVKPAEKRSYSQNVVVWVRQAGLQSDIQKILRHAKKLPEKTQQFYKELNRVRRAAISFGFVELLDGLAFIFERECTLLPGSAHPDCALQLTHAAQVLRRSFSRDIKYNITPMKTKFQSENE